MQVKFEIGWSGEELPGQRLEDAEGVVFVDVHTPPDGTKAFHFKGFLCRGNLMWGCLISAKFSPG